MLTYFFILKIKKLQLSEKMRSFCATVYIRRDLGKSRLERWGFLARGENELLKAEGE